MKKLRPGAPRSRNDAAAPTHRATAASRLRHRRRDALHGAGPASTPDADATVGHARMQALDAALTQARAQAEAAERTKRSLLANVSHEIRTPLNAIIGLTHLLRQEGEASRAERLDQVSDAARHLLAVFNDVLDLSKIESGAFELETQEFLLDTLLSRSCARVAAEAQRKGLELVISAPHLPGTLRGDPTRLSQALVNLLGNAVKFTERGAVTLSVSMTRREDGDALLRFEVRDTGIGIGSVGLDRLYSAFEQVDDSATRQHGGTGLGLALARHLARVMGGDAGATSQLGVGSTFWFTARLETVDAAPDHVGDGPLNGRRVLLVDDLIDAREAIGELLQRFGMRVDAAVSGEDAIAMADRAERAGTPYDVMLIDRMMPGMDGLQTARALIEQAGAAMPAFILVSGTVEVDFIAQAKELDIGSVLQKPLSVASLHGHLLRVLMDRDQDEGDAATAAADEPRASLRARFRDARVLLAEDHPINQRMASTLLRLAGFDVDVAATGTEAVALSAQRLYDLILMDVQMPEMDGLEATRCIRAQPGRETLPIVAMTANVFLDDRVACLAAGMNEHIGKPVDPPFLYDTLARWLAAPDDEAPRSGWADIDGAKVELAALDPLPGLMPSRGLRFFGNDASTYKDALGQYATMYAEGLTSVARPAQAAGHVLRELHSLAGASAAIGATALHVQAADAEGLLRASPLRPPKLQLQALHVALISFAAGLRTALVAMDEA